MPHNPVLALMTSPTRLNLALLCCLALLVSGCAPDPADNSPKTSSSSSGSATGEAKTAELAISEREVATDPDGKPVTLFQLTNSHGMEVEVISWGAVVLAIRVPDRDNHFENVTLGFEKVEGYFEPGPYFGAICGRYSNRIAKGLFSIGDKKYQLATNNDANHLHGGDQGFNRRAWTGKAVKKDGAVGVALKLVSPDGEENYPGTLTVDVTYWLTENSELAIEYKATTDKPTVLNLTNHCYWNLAGAGNGTILDHHLTLDCDKFLPVSDSLIPTGKPAAVAGSAMDFTSTQPIGSRIKQVKGGYDHCYVINGADGSLKPVAEIYDPGSGRVMEILTTEPGIQFYTGNFLDGKPANGSYPLNGGFCLECQHFPDSPNQPNFPSTLLKPGETYSQITIHRFSVRPDETDASAPAPQDADGGDAKKKSTE